MRFIVKLFYIFGAEMEPKCDIAVSGAHRGRSLKYFVSDFSISLFLKQSKKLVSIRAEFVFRDAFYNKC